MSFTSEKQLIYTIESASEEKFLYLNDETLAATGKHGAIEDRNVYFYVVNVPDTRGNGRYQLKPLAEPELYVAVVNGQLALKAENECMEWERSFYYTTTHIYWQRFHVRSEDGNKYFVFCENDGKLVATPTENLEVASWFSLLLIDPSVRRMLLAEE